MTRPCGNLYQGNIKPLRCFYVINSEGEYIRISLRSI